MERWIKRAQKIISDIEKQSSEDSSSYLERTRRFWLGDEEFSIGKIVGWIFEAEESGFRMK